MNNVDKEYFRLVKTILDNGRIKHNRTGIDTISVFGEQAKYKVSLNEFPILTTKKVWFKGIVHELLWFIKGDTNIKYLVDNDVHIWDEWAFKRNQEELVNFQKKWPNSDVQPIEYKTQEEFIEAVKKYMAPNGLGDLGEGTYGGMWRSFPYHMFTDVDYDTNKRIDIGCIDQLQKIIDKLKTNPDDRRMIISAWHPYWVDHCALPPCHCLFHFNTEELTWGERIDLGEELHPKTNLLRCSDDELDGYNIPRRRLNCLLYQRSCDFPLGIPFNITSYSLLIAMIAHVTNMEPGIFTHTYGDAHIYVNQIEGIKEQMKREPRKLPKLWLNPSVKSLFDFKYEDIKLEGYDPHPSIKFDIAV